jgi:hypothetical protein
MVVEFVPGTTISFGMAVYVPALHVQLPTAELAFGALVPAGQETHVVATVAPVVVEYVPVKQSVHAVLPITVLYFPATHAAHGPPSGPVEPTLQPADTHAVTLELPAADVVPAGHETHTFDDDVAVTQLFSCAEACAKSALDRCVFQI